jgi:hypothetical protein
LWGRQDARKLKQYFADLPPQVKQDLVDNAPSDVKDRAEATPSDASPLLWGDHVAALVGKRQEKAAA